jgi:hypothetical protein
MGWASAGMHSAIVSGRICSSGRPGVFGTAGKIGGAEARVARPHRFLIAVEDGREDTAVFVVAIELHDTVRVKAGRWP